MSLIQQALEKTNRVQETRTANPSPAAKTYERDPMGASLEQELTHVQQSYAKRRKLYWKISLGVLLVCCAGGLAFVGLRSNKSATSGVEAQAVPQVPVRIFSGYIYRLTGISNINEKPIAVINNRLVGVGDALNKRAVVKAIGKGEVRLDVEGKEIILTL